MKNNDFDFIKSQFDEARVDIPDELDKRVQSKLNNAHPAKIKFRQTTAFKAGMSIAACVAVFVMVITTVNVSDIDYRIKSGEDTSSASQLQNFDDYDKVEKYIKKSQKAEAKKARKSKTKGLVSPELIEYMTDSAETSKSTGAETYIQEKGVDEADIIKTNGNDIYYLNQTYDEKNNIDKRAVNVIETKNGKSTVANTIELDDTNSVIEDMFVSDDKLVVNCTSFSSSTVASKGVENHNATKAIVYDISDIDNPTEVNSFEQSGVYISSRLVGDTFYIVSSYGINSDSKVKNYIPKTCTGNGDSDKLDAKDIYYAKNGVGTSYVVVTALDVNTCETVGTTKAVLGCGEDVYSNKDYLYVYGSDYSDSELNTTIAKISLKDGVKFCDYVKIKGCVDSQYSFSEKDNHLCVFTTQTVKDKDCNFLYVFDSNLKQIYKSDAFAKGESIKAVKYIDDYAYVITYEQTDPLFIINLSNVKKPKFMGNVEIDGFSSMLVNVGGGQLLGVGYNTYFEDGAEISNGLKFVLFDVSNPLEPKVLDEKVYRALSSEAQYNPKALVENKEKGYYAVPVVNNSYTQKGAIVVSVKNGKIVEKENYSSTLKNNGSSLGSEPRVTYIGNYYYLVDNSLDISSFKLN